MYDDFGNLTYTLPPKVVTGDGVSATELSELCYQYTYDHRNRLVEKKVPGKGWEEIVYNKLDRPILTRDPNLKANDQWLFTKYDAFGRVAYTGLVSSTSSRSAHQTAADQVAAQYESPSATPTKFESNTVSVHYGNGAYPKTDLSKIHTINHYDGYVDANGLSVPTKVLEQATATNTRGLATVGKVRVLGTSNWITTITGYDVKGRPIYTASKNGYLNTTDIVETQLDFGGKVVRTKTSHTRGTNAALVTTDSLSYDHRGRLLKQEQTIGSHTETIVENGYDDLGQLVSKKVGGGLQDVNYGYNVRGWLTDINDVGNTAKLFNFRIGYNQGTNPLYNGNISRTQWRTANSDDSSLKSYDYTYDALNRIISAADNTGNYSLANVTYDKNGNIGKLKRLGWTVESPSLVLNTGFGTMDDLVYTYDNGNKLTKVLDNGNDTYGFTDSSANNQDYWYDANGNMTSDLNKGIAANGIEYNHLNMPTKITVSNAGANNGVVDYVYAADRTKLQKRTTQGGNVTTTDYNGNYVYENGNLKQITQPEGYIEPDGGSWQYVYRYADIWGNTRITYADDNGDGSVDSSEIRREQNYYPFGMEHKGYNSGSYGVENNLKTYQGQDFMEDLGLNIHEWKYRVSDPSIGRFWQVDPKASNYPYNAVYAFQENKLGSGIELEGAENHVFNRDPLLNQSFNTLTTGETSPEDLLNTSKDIIAADTAAASLFLPGPEDLVIGAFVATKIGGAVLKGLSKLFGRSVSKADDAIEVASDVKKVNKNANDAEGNFVLYEVKQSDEILKVGKADADDVMADGTTIRRVHTSTRKAKKEGYENATGEVVEDLGTTTTKKAKQAEAARVRNLRENGNELPLNRERDKSYKPNNGS
ncbi:hypothetical protein L0P88_22125 [Muricauda sp. SCSIO 64092]|uniref:hypothetical protein n=1 Tax=Allomuricauda sp. SCSIO 64092 TaxID=2908842 RepID=UPI001FF168D2|nr:hypothetical protein [Muricauda sp. SCSIO 64092]UOY06607.1 hypothetical protein L0P88_22125 [Muricauda sp. SCSIO 64092]